MPKQLVLIVNDQKLKIIVAEARWKFITHSHQILEGSLELVRGSVVSRTEAWCSAVHSPCTLKWSSSHPSIFQAAGWREEEKGPCEIIGEKNYIYLYL